MVKGRISRGGQFWVEAANLEVRATLEQDTKRWRDGWCQLRSRIEWLEAKEQQGSGQSKLRTSGDLVVFREKGTRVFWVEPGHVMPGPGWLSRGVAFALGAERAAGLVGVDVCSWSDSRSVECRGGCLGVKPRRVAGTEAYGGRLQMVRTSHLRSPRGGRTSRKLECPWRTVSGECLCQ